MIIAMDYQEVEYDDELYCVCPFMEDGIEEKLFIIDSEYVGKLGRISSEWLSVKDHIVSPRKTHKGKRKHVEVAKIIMKSELAECKDLDDGEHYVVDHINGNYADLRKANLRIVPKNVLLEKRVRRMKKEMPRGSKVKIDDLPKGMIFNHGAEKFEIKFTHEGTKYCVPLTASKGLSIKAKFEGAKQSLIDFAKAHPEVAKSKGLLENYSKKSIRLMKEFNEIIDQSNYYECIDDSFMNIPERKVLKADFSKLTESERRILTNAKKVAGTGRRPMEVDTSNIPKFCCYRQPTDKRGGYYFIKNHPNLPRGKEIRTCGSKNVTKETKYIELMQLLREV